MIIVYSKFIKERKILIILVDIMTLINDEALEICDEEMKSNEDTEVHNKINGDSFYQRIKNEIMRNYNIIEKISCENVDNIKIYEDENSIKRLIYKIINHREESILWVESEMYIEGVQKLSDDSKEVLNDLKRKFNLSFVSVKYFKIYYQLRSCLLNVQLQTKKSDVEKLKNTVVASLENEKIKEHLNNYYITTNRTIEIHLLDIYGGDVGGIGGIDGNNILENTIILFARYCATEEQYANALYHEIGHHIVRNLIGLSQISELSNRGTRSYYEGLGYHHKIVDEEVFCDTYASLMNECYDNNINSLNDRGMFIEKVKKIINNSNLECQELEEIDFTLE